MSLAGMACRASGLSGVATPYAIRYNLATDLWRRRAGRIEEGDTPLCIAH
jgi:hypothetical protein